MEDWRTDTGLWYWSRMKRKRQSIAETQESIAKITAMVEANSTLLRQLDERLNILLMDQARFQIAVAGKLSRIEAMVQILRISELIHTLGQYPKCELNLFQKLEQQDQMIDEHSREIEGRMLDLMQGVTSTRRSRRRSKPKARAVGETVT